MCGPRCASPHDLHELAGPANNLTIYRNTNVVISFADVNFSGFFLIKLHNCSKLRQEVWKPQFQINRLCEVVLPLLI